MSIEAEPEIRSGEELMRLGADIVAAYVSRNAVAAEAVPEIIRSVYGALEGLSKGPAPAPEEKPRPAVPVGRSIQHDYIICLEDGKRYTMLKRPLRTHFNLTPEQYRARWGLPESYPMVAASHQERQAEAARGLGLGHRTAEFRRAAAERREKAEA